MRAFLLLSLITTVSSFRNSFLRYYEVTEAVASSRGRSKRDSDEDALRFSFSLRAFNRTLTLDVVEGGTSVLSPDFKQEYAGSVSTDHQPNLDISYEVVGTVRGDPGSYLWGFIDKDDLTFEGEVALSDGITYYVEGGELSNGKRPTIVYKADDLIYPGGDVRRRRDAHDATDGLHGEAPSFCGWSKPKIKEELLRDEDRADHEHHTMNLHSSSRLHDHVTFSDFVSTEARRKREARDSRSDPARVCGLYMQADPHLHNYFVKEYKDKADGKLLEFFKKLVVNLNQIYGKHTFTDAADPGKGSYSNIQFVIYRSKIFAIQDCQNYIKENSNLDPKIAILCKSNIDVTNFLHLNSQWNHTGYCLAYMFTSRDFADGILGLAWVAKSQRSQAGGICERTPIEQSDQDRKYKEYMNTGVVTIMNHGQRVPVRISSITFAHEVGHNFGAPHDETPECKPGGNDGNYIMYPSATGGSRTNNDWFSPCSIKSITAVLDSVTNSRGKVNCFKNSSEPHCGNQIVEGKEMCDCGYEDQCLETCCHHSESAGPLKCTLRPNKLCSPSQGPCCEYDTCNFDVSSKECSKVEECRHASKCNGSSAICPLASHKPDDQICGNNTKICSFGECRLSICNLIQTEDKLRRYEECQTRENDNKSNRGKLCYVACKSPTSDTCWNSMDYLEKGFDPTFKDFLGTLTYEGQKKQAGPLQLQTGSPCNQMRGYCDVFNKCRNLDAEGPLSRLTNQIFNTAIPNFITWLGAHWWWALAIAAGVILFMALFIKFCSVHTPSNNPNLPPAQRWGDTLRLRRHHDPQGRPPPTQQEQRHDPSRAALDPPPPYAPAAASQPPPGGPPRGRGKRRQKKGGPPPTNGVDIQLT